MGDGGTSSQPRWSASHWTREANQPILDTGKGSGVPISALLNPGDWLGMKPRIDPGLTPFEFHYRPDGAEIRLRAWVGSIVLAGALIAAWWNWGDWVAVFIGFGVGLLAVLNLVYAALQSRFSLDLAISSFEVSMKTRTVFGERHWREGLRAYRGILLRDEELDGDSVGTKTVKRYYIVELYHEDASKTVPLYVTEGGPAPHEIQQAFGRRFNLPLLTSGMEGVARAGQATRGIDPGPAPAGVHISEDGGVTCMSLRAGFASRLLIIGFWLLAPAGIGLLVYQIEPELGTFAGAGAAGFFLLLLLLHWLMNRNTPARGLCIGPRGVWIGAMNARSPVTLWFGTIRNVRADRGRGGRYRLIIEESHRRLQFSGGSFDRPKIEWMRDYLLYRMSQRVVQ